jgi:hypothetical protein
MCTQAVLSGSKCSFKAEEMSRKMVACTISELNRKPKIKKVFYQNTILKCLYGVIHIGLYGKILLSNVVLSHQSCPLEHWLSLQQENLQNTLGDAD